MSAFISPQITFEQANPAAPPLAEPAPSSYIVLEPPDTGEQSGLADSTETNIALASSKTNDIRNAQRSVPAIFKKIAYCESGNRQFDAKGRVVRGLVNPQDIGRYQINMAVWGTKAKQLGINVFSEDGNEEMALFIHTNYGLDPWNASRGCWNR